MGRLITKRKLIYFVAALLLGILLKYFVFEVYQVNGISMSPFLNSGDIVFCDKLTYLFDRPKHSDIVILNYDGNKIIKRVIGCPGDIVSYKNDCVYLNNRLLRENELSSEASVYTVPDKCYYVIGDNNISIDSRIFGAIDSQYIQGKFLFKISH